MAMMPQDSDQTPLYPVRLWMEYPEKLSRLTTFFRIILAIPVLLFLYLLQTNVVLAIWVAILIRGRIPRWLFDFEVGLNRFTSRAGAYLLLLADKYPAFDSDWELQYWVDYPERSSRWKLVLWKVMTAVPHVIALIGLWIAVGVVTVIAWFAILFTGKYPRGLHAFVVGTLRWSARLTAYVESLTDEFPPFSLEHDVPPGLQERAFAIIGAVVLAIVIASGIGIGIAVNRYISESESVTVSYTDALAGDLSPGDGFLDLDFIGFSVIGGDDDVDTAQYGNLLSPRGGKRLVEFRVSYVNVRDDEDSRLGAHDIETDTVRLKTEDGVVSPILLTVDGVVAPENVERGPAVEIMAVFEIDEGDQVLELRAYTGNSSRHVAWKFE